MALRRINRYLLRIRLLLLVACAVLGTGKACFAQDSLYLKRDSLRFQGQFSAWTNINPNNALPVLLGARYLPGANYSRRLSNHTLFDVEASVNLYGAVSTQPFTHFDHSGGITPYRAWARLSAAQWEIRLGLQKINFGSASLLRPLMWFDQIDPRDPLQITNGVWGLLGRYYFLNNANIWLWSLYGNRSARPWDIGTPSRHFPELGGRIQVPTPKGELGLSYHFRKANLEYSTSPTKDIPEDRIGFDGRFDLGIGLWFEGAWIGKRQVLGFITNQEILNLGIDYTFGIGNGLHLVAEQLLYAGGAKAFDFEQHKSFSGLSLSYPLGISDNLSAIVYVDAKGKKAYNFLNWQHIFRRFSSYFMAYWNPKVYNLPQQGSISANNYAGAGLQIMFVFNH